ncbi:spermatogenesis-defective protein 39 homolog [Amphiura filiformis]|uniref:spermatogenesis-defective protein 39 homolog n=1 Tax=Amphiura filiformis TaxID=82378 RepID=UPI003B219C93
MAVNFDEDEDDEYWSGRSRPKANLFDDDVKVDSRGMFGAIKKEAQSFDDHLTALGLGREEDETDDTITTDWKGNVVNEMSSKGSSHPKAGSQSHPALMTSSSGIQSARGTGGNVRISSSSVSYNKDSSSMSGFSDNLRPNFNTHTRSASFGTLGEKRPTVSNHSTPVSSNSASSTSLEEAVRREMKTPTNTDMAKLQAEIQSLNRRLKSAEKSRWAPLSVADTVTRIILGDRYSLEPYRSLKDKLALLDAAVGNHDGNAILVVVLFMRKTLSKTVFYEQLSKRPEAANQYIAYIKMHHEKRDSVATEMGHLCRLEEAAMWRYGTANLSSIPHARLKNLMECHGMWFERNPNLTEEATSMKEQIELLNKQLLVEATDDKNEREGRSPFKEMPRKANLYFQPLTTTLFYCSKYHYGESEVRQGVPLHLKREFQLSEKHYLLVALRARSMVKKWDDLEPLLTSKNWRGKARIKSVVKFEQVVNILVQNKAPPGIIDKFLRLVEDEETRMDMARKHKQHEVIIDTLFQMKDRQRLVEYQRHVPHRTDAARHIEDLLRNSGIKWKN